MTTIKQRCEHGRLATINYTTSTPEAKNTHRMIPGYKYCLDCGQILKVTYEAI